MCSSFPLQPGGHFKMETQVSLWDTSSLVWWHVVVQCWANWESCAAQLPVKVIMQVWNRCLDRSLLAGLSSWALWLRCGAGIHLLTQKQEAEPQEKQIAPYLWWKHNAESTCMREIKAKIFSNDYMISSALISRCLTRHIFTKSYFVKIDA